MRARKVILSGLAFILLSAPFALAEKGRQKKCRRSPDIAVWFEGYFGGGDHSRLGAAPLFYGEVPLYRRAAPRFYDDEDDDYQGLPPGLAKRDRLPPGLEKHLWKHGSLPPGLQKKLDPYGWKHGKKSRYYEPD